jgi:hypothetical protein
VITSRLPDRSDAFAEPDTLDGLRHPLPTTAFHSDHLLGVAGAVNRDAQKLWADLWGEFKEHITSDGRIMPEMDKGFVPRGGWKEFMEKFWLLKHYLDSVSRVCRHK